MKKNRYKGFSMIELIIVVAIIGIFTALAGMGFGYLKSGNVKAAARNIDATLTKLKLDTMKQNKQPVMYIYKKGSDYYMYCTANSFTVPHGTGDAAVGQKIGNHNVKISAVVGSTTTELNNNGDNIQIKFNKGSGTFISDYTHIYVTERTESGSKSGITYDVEMIKETGKHFINVN